ncbi:MAG: phosphate/phosphite/phosphonate ABC transporter substrate-binding protein [Nitrospirota bacterium]
MITRNNTPFVIAVTLAVLLSFCSGPAQSQEKEPLKLCVHPYLSASELVKRYTPLAEYLGRELGRPVMLEIGTSYDAHIHRIANGLVDIAFMGPASYVKLTSQYGKRPLLAAFKTKEGKFFHGHIMVRKDSPVAALAQLKGKRFVFGDRSSTLSHIVPRYMLQKAGIDLKDFSQVSYVANHDNIALGILAGTFDAGAVKEEVFLQYEPQGLRSLARSAPITDHVFIARDNLPKETVHALRKAFLQLSDSAGGRQIISGMRSDVIALVPSDERDFDALRAIMNELKQAGVEL